MQKPRKCKSCQIEYIPRTFAQPRCQKCNFQRLKEKAKTYKPLKAERNPEQETNAKFKQSRYKPIFDVCYKFIPLYKRLLNNITLGIFNKYIFSDI